MGCDATTIHNTSRDTCFNPRTRMGCDFPLRQNVDAADWFQSTHPHGVRQSVDIQRKNTIRFQSTHPHGVRPHQQATQRVGGCFNPRTRMGCDNGGFRKVRRRNVSIHAPAWGATTVFALRVITTACFNPRTRMGCDLRRQKSVSIQF